MDLLPALGLAVGCAVPRTPATSSSPSSSSSPPRGPVPATAAVASAEEPLAPAPTEPLPYDVKPVRLPLSVARVTAIHGTSATDVWLVADTHLLRSDGRRTVLVHRNPCHDPNSFWATDYGLIRAKPGEVTLYGTTNGANQQFELIARSVRGRLLCPAGDGTNSVDYIPRGHDVAFFESAGQAWMIEKKTDGGAYIEGVDGGSNFFLVQGSFDGDHYVVSVARDSAHGWLVDVEKNAGESHLLEWTGVRWRERKDVLPSGILPGELVAFADAAGTAWATTPIRLFRFDGLRFRPVSVPQDYSAAGLFAPSAEELWVFGRGVVYRLLGSTWQTKRLPFVPTKPWRAPNGELWLVGYPLEAPAEGQTPAPGSQGAQVIRLVPVTAGEAPR